MKNKKVAIFLGVLLTFAGSAYAYDCWSDCFNACIENGGGVDNCSYTCNQSCGNYDE